MYRLFKLRNLCLYKNTFTSNTLSAVKLPKLCTSCHNISYYETCSNGFVRYQSTRSHSLLQNTKKRKRVKKTPRKPSASSNLAGKSEVVACNNSDKNDKENEENLTKRRSSTEIEGNNELTSLNKFACKDLVFSDEESYSKEFQELDMYSPKEIEKMMNNPVLQECILEDIDITNEIDLDNLNKTTPIEQQPVSELQDSVNTISEDVDAGTQTVVDASQTEIAKEKKIKTKKAVKDISKDAIARQEGSYNLTRLLLAYSGLCVAQSCPQNALAMLTFYRDRARAYSHAPKIVDIRIYDCIMEGFATKANIEKVTEIFKMIKSDGLKPTVQSYVAVFECLGRMKKSVINKIKLLHFRCEMEKYGFSLNDLLNKGKFTTNQRSVVYAAIRRLERKFKPEYTPPFIQYECRLVQELNDPRQQELLNPKNIVEDVKLDEALHDLPKTLSEIPKTIPENIPYNLPIKFNENINVDCSLFSGVNTHIGADYVSQNTFFSPLEYKSGINMFSRIDATNSLESCLSNDMKYQNIRNYINLKFEKLIAPKKDVKVAETNVEKVSNSAQQLFSQNELAKQLKTQFELEEAGFITIDSIASEPKITDEILHFRKQLEDMQEHWKRKLLQNIERKLSAMKSRHDKNEATLVAALQSVPISDLANIALHAARTLAEGSETFSQSVNVLYRDMGAAVHTRYQVLLKKRNGVLSKVSSIYERYADWYINDYMTNKEKAINPRQYWQSLVHLDRTGASVDIEDKEWPLQLVIAIGKFLFERILFDLKVDVNSVRPTNSNINLLPAFFTVFRNQKYVIKEEPKAHPVVCRLFREAQFPKLTFPVNIIPMKCPPKPWVTPNMGGYLIINTDMVRLPPQATQQLQRFREVPPQNLYPVVDSLNELGSVPWTVNKKVLCAALEVFRSGGDSKLGVAPPPSSLAPIPPLPATATRSERAQMHYQRLVLQKRQGELYSLWCDALYRLSLANHFKDDVFWLPHNIDFRGRVYPVPPHLTHLGADLARSLLVFAEKKPLGPDGLRWLKLHLVNLTGIKKKNSIDERLEYAEEMMPEILDSADNPLKGRRWWAESEEPWQTLACCCEIANAVRSPDPEKYCTQFPVHQDGSCNGLQHYAALGRDEAGARSVNLALSERPQDVYSAVVDLVEGRRKVDAENGVKVAQLLDGYIKRKVIKQTIMTTVYGVTKFGARLQISKQLKDTDFPKEHVWAASLYLTTKTFESLRTMFTSTKEIQDWFTECAKLIATVRERNVEWVTPLGLPIVQHYVRYTRAPKMEGKVRENFTMDTKVACPNVMKQKNAFPPNFIHSLDSTHMMLTSLFSERAGITFVSVHDCFWTHPSTVNIMNKICREQFVALHSQPILEDLSDFLYKTCSFSENNLSNDGSVSDNSKRRLNRILRKLPAKGTFDLNSVLDSVYFFS